MFSVNQTENSGELYAERYQTFPLSPNDRERFISDNQKAFNYGALEEFGCRDTRFEDDGEANIVVIDSTEGGSNGG